MQEKRKKKKEMEKYLSSNNSHGTHVFECFVESFARERLGASNGDEFEGAKGTQNCPKRTEVAAEEARDVNGREDGENEECEFQQCDKPSVNKGMRLPGHQKRKISEESCRGRNDIENGKRERSRVDSSRFRLLLRTLHNN